jgi:hypothetical protein
VPASRWHSTDAPGLLDYEFGTVADSALNPLRFQNRRRVICWLPDVFMKVLVAPHAQFRIEVALWMNTLSLPNERHPRPWRAQHVLEPLVRASELLLSAPKPQHSVDEENY